MRNLLAVARAIDWFNERVGRIVSWLALFMVVEQFVIVLMRYVFGEGSIAMQESVIYMHATVFMMAAGYTLLHNGHVRCDIVYAAAAVRHRAWVDLFGVAFFLMPMAVVIGIVSWPYVAESWRIHEHSLQGNLGLPIVYILKSVILGFVIVIMLQGIALALHSLFVILGIEQQRPVEAEEIEGM